MEPIDAAYNNFIELVKDIQDYKESIKMEDEKYCIIPEHDAYNSQRQLTISLAQIKP